jgi:Histidine kinase
MLNSVTGVPAPLRILRRLTSGDRQSTPAVEPSKQVGSYRGGRLGSSGAIPAIAITLAVHVLVQRAWPPSREKELAERVDVFTRSRHGIVDVQPAEFKRIERDLHDGALARIVSLAMNPGLARQLARRDPGASASSPSPPAYRSSAKHNQAEKGSSSGDQLLIDRSRRFGGVARASSPRRSPLGRR